MHRAVASPSAPHLTTPFTCCTQLMNALPLILFASAAPASPSERGAASAKAQASKKKGAASSKRLQQLRALEPLREPLRFVLPALLDRTVEPHGREAFLGVGGHWRVLAWMRATCARVCNAAHGLGASGAASSGVASTQVLGEALPLLTSAAAVLTTAQCMGGGHAKLVRKRDARWLEAVPDLAYTSSRLCKCTRHRGVLPHGVSVPHTCGCS